MRERKRGRERVRESKSERGERESKRKRERGKGDYSTCRSSEFTSNVPLSIPLMTTVRMSAPSVDMESFCRS